jgi:hypothetical protein
MKEDKSEEDDLRLESVLKLLKVILHYLQILTLLRRLIPVL